MLGFNNLHSARVTLVGIKFIAMIDDGQMKKAMQGSLSTAEQSYALAAYDKNRFYCFSAN